MLPNFHIRRFFVLCCLWLAGLAAAAAPAELAHGGGLQYFNEVLPEGPNSIHVVRIPRTNSEFELHTTLPPGGQFGLTALSEQVAGMPPGLGRPVAAVNGDFYRKEEPYVGDPKGLHIFEGELTSAPSDWTCFYVDTNGAPQIAVVTPRFKVSWPGGESFAFGLNEERPKNTAVLFTHAVGASTHTEGGREFVLEGLPGKVWLPLKPGFSIQARFREKGSSGDSTIKPGTAVLSISSALASRLPEIEAGGVIEFSTMTLPDLKGVRTAIGGGPALIHKSKPINSWSNQDRHPRTAVGFNSESIFLVEVDGRQSNLSIGMTLEELAAYMKKLGCEEAMNLDGGGSATMWVRGQVVNSPSEGRERGTANALVVVQKNKPETAPHH